MLFGDADVVDGCGDEGGGGRGEEYRGGGGGRAAEVVVEVLWVGGACGGGECRVEVLAAEHQAELYAAVDVASA